MPTGSPAAQPRTRPTPALRCGRRRPAGRSARPVKQIVRRAYGRIHQRRPAAQSVYVTGKSGPRVCVPGERGRPAVAPNTGHRCFERQLGVRAARVYCGGRVMSRIAAAVLALTLIGPSLAEVACELFCASADHHRTQADRPGRCHDRRGEQADRAEWSPVPRACHDDDESASGAVGCRTVTWSAPVTRAAFSNDQPAPRPPGISARPRAHRPPGSRQTPLRI